MNLLVDTICLSCEYQKIDVFVKDRQYQPCEKCGGPTERLWTAPPAVVGDECDIWIKHGICNSDGTPKRYRSKAEIKRAAKEAGWVNRVEHIGRQGSDKSEHTSRWI